MLNQQLISRNFQPASLTDSVQQALDYAYAHEHNQVMVQDKGKVLGMIGLDILETADARSLLQDLQYRIQPLGVKGKDHVFRAAAIFSAMPGISFLPVVDDEGQFEGVVEKDAVFIKSANLLGMQDNGALVVLDLDSRHFSVGEISKLVETNDAQITQLNTSPGDNGRLLVTIRVNTPEVSDIVATMQRYDYSVVYFEGEETYRNQLRQNYDLLMNFLEM